MTSVSQKNRNANGFPGIYSNSTPKKYRTQIYWFDSHAIKLHDLLLKFR